MRKSFLFAFLYFFAGLSVVRAQSTELTNVVIFVRFADDAEINGLRINTYNFEFEGAPSYFNANIFRHEMGHSLNLPDLYHYLNYSSVSPAGSWDMLCYNYTSNHTAAIYKNKILHVSDDPIEITEDGDYTLLSVGSSSSQNCYYIRSHIAPTQWYNLR